MLIAQLSDLHVRPLGMLCKDVVDSNRMLADAIAHRHRLDRRPDLVLISGDLVDDGRREKYEAVVAVLGTLRLPWIVMPGNHDDRANFRAAFGAQAYLPTHGPLHFCIDTHPVRIIALDSTVPGRHHGHLDAAGIDWLGLTCPSTATEIALKFDPAAQPQSFMGPPACLLHLWHPEHGLVSHPSYIG